MGFFDVFLTNLTTAFIIVIIYSIIIYLIIRHYSRAKMLLEKDDIFVTEKMKISSDENIILKVISLAMIIVILGIFIVVLVQLLNHYLSLIPTHLEKLL